MLPLIYCSPCLLPGAILETLIHISHSDQHTPGGLGLELSNVVDSSSGVRVELGSCLSSEYSLGGSIKPCIFTSTSCNTYYQFIIFLST
jgi:hypothetical protein